MFKWKKLFGKASNVLGLLVHLCLFHIYINAIGITTYEYVRAHRVAVERSAREMSEPTTSTAAGSATLRQTSAPNGGVNDGWNVVNANANTATSSSSSASTECRQNCRRLCVKVQIEPTPQPQKPHAIPNGNLNVPDGEYGDPPPSDTASPVRNGLHKKVFDLKTESDRTRTKTSPTRVSSGPVPSSGTVSAVPRLPMILSVDGISQKLDDVEKNSVKKISKHLDRVSHRHEFRDQIFIIDGE